MKITKFTYGNPDSDGDVRLDGTVVIENTSDFDVELVKISCTVLNSSGVTAGGNQSRWHTHCRDGFCNSSRTRLGLAANANSRLL